MTELDIVDRRLLDCLQANFSLALRPFAALAEHLGLDEADVLARVRRLHEQGVIRHIGAVWDTRRLGYQSTLAAFHVPEPGLLDVAAGISAHPGVSHNYARAHYYNLWFTLAIPPDRDMVAEIRRLAERGSVTDWLNLPALRTFKIRAHFRLTEDEDVPLEPEAGAGESVRALAAGDIPIIRVLQDDLALVSRPFVEPARCLGLSEEELLDKIRELQAAGLVRRLGAVLRHRRVGYAANGMVCWAVPEQQIEQAGQYAAGFSEVSHCYQRPSYPPRWPYNLFTMVHGRTTEEIEAVVVQIARQIPNPRYEILYSTREFKKERVRYFEEKP